MKMLPVERPVYQNLNTSFTSFQGLLDDLAARRLDGYIRLASQAYSGLLFLTGGAPAGAMDYPNGVRRLGSMAVRTFGERAQDRGGTIDVFELDGPLAGLLAGMADAEPVFRELSSEWVVIGRLLEAVHAECGEGRVDLRLVGDEGEAVAFFSGGVIVAAMGSFAGQSLTGEAALDFMTQQAQSAPARVSVFRAGAARDHSSDLAAAATVPPSAAAAPIGGRVAAATFEPEESPVLAAVTAAQNGPDPDLAASPPEPAAPAPMAEVLRSWASVISTVEGVIDEIGRKGQFSAAFREALIENAQTHPFLDPFAGEFTYSNGEIRMEAPMPDEFGKALNAVLDDTVRRLTFLLRREDLETLVRDRIAGTTAAASNRAPGAPLTTLQRAS